ncbi:sulfhydryl oxidase 1 [Trichonephila inaurata madagascariensis]|uniref:Sulfhydryl oxidase n=1 Tax=Trichonephila inaurata madagascariensis TaxID=2747483 RepID=A0A8X7CJK0_9ARAC|nr:sulfhydryl oxidase 1 [Trichonephila inaurata madagascariensis]
MIAWLNQCNVGCRQSSLYSEDDPLWELDSSNFNNVVLGKNNAWIIEFYNNWCGHCIRFVPTWKQFSREIKTWKRIIDVAVVNCNDPQNIKLCRFYEVDSFPTIKLFWHHTAQNDTGEMLNGKRDIISIENKIIDFLESHWNEGVPSDWPNLQPLPTQNLHEISREMHDPKQSIMLFAEFPESYIGRKVILDLSFQRNAVIRRILSTNEKLMHDLRIEVSNDTLPVLTRVYKNNFQMPLFKFSQDTNSTYIRDQIFEHVIGVSRSKAKKEDIMPLEKSSNVIPGTNAVYMVDLENAIYNLLSKEIGVTKLIDGEKLATLKSFLSVLKTYFPGTTPVMNFLARFYDWVINKNSSISGEEFVQAMEEVQDKTAFLPTIRSWVGCKGSEPKYRGYPCSLWTLFHTLTVQADKKDEETVDGPKRNQVLFTIRDYIKNFFTCEECSKNFLEMAENVENEVSTSREAVLWLWEAHNKVNHRLSGDVTEDPKYPKIQFPSSYACPKCQMKDSKNDEITWDKDLVLQFLHKFYDRKNILTLEEDRVQDSNPAKENLLTNNSAMGIEFILSPSSLLLLLLYYYFQQSLKMF